jgi:membrane protein
MKSIKRIIQKIEAFIRRTLRIIFMPLLFLSKKIVLPGFHGVPLYEVGTLFAKGLKKSSISLRANAITYSFIIAFVPAVLFLFALIPYIPVQNLQQNILSFLKEILPSSAFQTIYKTIEDILTNQQSGLLSVSFVISMYFASNGIIAIMNAFNQSSHSIETRNAFQKRLVSLLLVFILAINIIISAGAMAITSYIFYYMEAKGIIGDSITRFLLSAGQWVAILLTSLIAFSSIFYLAPAKRGSFPFFSAGSVLSAILSVVTFKIFVIFIENFSNVNKFYGSLGTLIIIIMWINLTALMLLIGFEINASIYMAFKNGDARKNDKNT